MDVPAGTRFGPYEVVSRIGAGGMGEVYRARDTRLDRSVAVKILASEFAHNAQLKLRFAREAKAISQLNHPHICTLYDVGDDYLVMELLEGDTLADRIARGPLPLSDVLKFGAQIASALDRAHRAGIVHRDLKPANVMITKSGAKLLDFGLAKAGVAQPIGPDSATVHHDKALTEEGTILGTFQYMAPEQLEGQEAGARTDIFALGTLLYEMATGARAFHGKTRTSLIASIVATQPQPLSQMIALAPPGLDHVIQKCLEKDPDERWQSAHDVAEELKWVAEAPAAEGKGSAHLSRWLMAAVLLLVTALIAVSTLHLKSRSARPTRTAFAIQPPDGFLMVTSAISPDGSAIYFSADSQDSASSGGIWIRRIDQIEAVRLTSSVDDFPVAWSSDSKWIAYTTRSANGNELRRIAVTGGKSEVLSRHISRAYSLAWAPDGTIVYSSYFGQGLSVLLPDGDAAKQLTSVDRTKRQSFHLTPVFLSDFRTFLYLVHTVAAEANEIWAGSIDGKISKKVFTADALVGFAQGRVYFARNGSVYAQEFNEDEIALVGEPVRVVERVLFSEPEAVAAASVASTGALSYRLPVEPRQQWGWYDRTGRLLEKQYEERGILIGPASPDGRRVLATKFDPEKGADDIHIVDLERKLRTKLTSGRSFHRNAIWNRVGDRIYFASDRDGPYDIYVQADDGTTPAEIVWKGENDKIVEDITLAGDALICIERTENHRGDIWLVPVNAPEKRRALVATEADEDAASLSPDGKWLAYRSDRSGRTEFYVRLLEGGRSIQISTDGATGLVWSADGREVLVRNFEGSRLAIPLTFSATEARPGPPRLLFQSPGQRALISVETERGILMSVSPYPSDFIVPLYFDSAPIPIE